MAFPRLRYSKRALLVFGAGLVLGLAVVSAGLDRFGPVASVMMALGIMALPVAVIADLRRIAPAKPKSRPRTRTAHKRRQPAARPRTRRR